MVLSSYLLGKKTPLIEPSAAALPALPSLPPAPPVHRDAGPTLEQVRRLSTLVTTRVDVADVQETSIEGHTGGVWVAVLVRGDFLLGVDLSKARFESKDLGKKQAVLVLPPPQVTSPRLDHDRTRLFGLSPHGLWHVVPGDAGRTHVVAHGLRHAQEVVAAAAKAPAVAEKSRRSVEETLRSFFEAFDWKVVVRWEDQPPPTTTRSSHAAPH
jgi:hypothetical protein